MDPKEYLTKMGTIQINILDFIDEVDNPEDFFQNILLLFDTQQIKNSKLDLKLLFHFLLKISNNHHRFLDFYNKIERILQLFTNEITNFFSNSEIFKIFKNNKRILLFLIKEKLFIIDKYIANEMVTNDKFNEAKYIEYFLPEIQQIFDDFHYKTIPDNFEEKRKIGENDDFVCELIRNDLVDEFITYVNKTNYSLESKIVNSIYETNSFLIENYTTTLIEYAAFFGSIQIFQYLILNKVKLNQSLWIYAIHGKNAQIIHLLEENQLKPNENTLNKCLIESIKCHHNDIANYIQDVYFQIKENKINDFISQSIRSYNFSLIQCDLINQSSSFYDLCQYEYYYLVDFLLKNEDINVNNKIIFK